MKITTDATTALDAYQLLTAAMAKVLQGGGRLERVVRAEFLDEPYVELIVIDPTLPMLPSGRITVSIEPA